MFSFGVKERLNQETNQLTGYSGKNENEKAFFEAINKFPEICQQNLEEDFGPDADSCLNQFSLLETNWIYGQKREKEIQEGWISCSSTLRKTYLFRWN